MGVHDSTQCHALLPTRGGSVAAAATTAAPLTTLVNHRAVQCTIIRRVALTASRSTAAALDASQINGRRLAGSIAGRASSCLRNSLNREKRLQLQSHPFINYVWKGFERTPATAYLKAGLESPLVRQPREQVVHCLLVVEDVQKLAHRFYTHITTFLMRIISQMPLSLHTTELLFQVPSGASNVTLTHLPSAFLNINSQ